MKTRILVMDDDAPVRESLAKVLREEDYEVIVAGNGQEAVQRVEEGAVDLLLFDLGVPVKSGWDAVERIAQGCPLVPIIVITCQADQYRAAIAAGVEVLMEKPLDVPQLLHKLRDVLAEPLQPRPRQDRGAPTEVSPIFCEGALLRKRLREQQRTPCHPKLVRKPEDPRGE